MKSLIKCSLLLMIVCFIAGCNLINTNKKSDDIYLRISNVSSVTFNSVYISFPGDEETFENIPQGETSEYRKMLTAYRYGYIKLEVGDEEYVLQPIDFVGEDPLNNGKYTYRIGISGDSITMNFVKD